MIDRPIGAAIADALDHDLVRGVVATDALIGTFAKLDDPSLQQNVCFLYHLLGGGVGDWNVPIGGMGAVSAALAAAATAHGAEILTGAEVYRIDPAVKCVTAGTTTNMSCVADSCCPGSRRPPWPACSAIRRHRRRRAHRSKSTWCCGDCRGCATTTSRPNRLSVARCT